MQKESWNSMSIILLTLSFFFVFIFNSQEVCSAPSSKHLCLPKQRDALLEFKNEIEIGELSRYYFCGGQPKMESWGNNTDCCYWDGVTCDTKSGEVVELDLRCSHLHGLFRSNSKLFRIQSLRSLDLSDNDLSGQIMWSIGNFSHLITLRLSDNHFSGRVPSSIGDLSNLTSLNLDFNNFDGAIPSSLGNLSHLTYLNLNFNNLVGEIPYSLGNLSDLTNLNLWINRLVGEIPSSFGSLNNLDYLDVGDNKLSGGFPLPILNLTKLSSLYLPNNQFTGMLPSSLFTLPSLEFLDLENNQFHGTLELGNISSPSKLNRLSLGNNNFVGSIPISLSKLVNLDRLDLSYLNTQGPIDLNIFSHLKSLQSLDISYLNTTTTIDLNAILSVNKMLVHLYLSGNHVSVTNKSSVSDPPSQSIMGLSLSGCGITEFPKFLRTQPKMLTLDIWNNRIKGQVPAWLWTLPKLRFVELSNNDFTGFDRPKKHRQSSVLKSPSMRYFRGSNNNFRGKIPSFLCMFDSLEVLDLSYNSFNGSIPRCMGNLIKRSLSVLKLGDDQLSGKVPDIFLSGSNLTSLNVGHNQLVGKLPRSLSNCSSLETLNVEHNRINDTFPFWLESLQQLQVLVLHSNEFHGSLQHHPKVTSWFPQLRIINISNNSFNGTLQSDFFMYWSAMSLEGNSSGLSYFVGDTLYYEDVVLMNKGVELTYTKILTLLNVIDISGNQLQGEIPKSVGLLKSLIVLNLSSNGFSGNIPSSLANLTKLESLDLSHNKLSGQIPPALGVLTSLSKIVVSHNQLIGPIPQGTQFQTQDASCFEDNLGLCNRPLSNSCGDKDREKSQEPESEEEEEILSWTAAAIALTPGVIFGFTVGHIVITQKPHWLLKIFEVTSFTHRFVTKWCI